MKEQIEYTKFLEIEESFKLLDIRLGHILEVERIPKSDKLLKLNVHFGELGNKTVVTNIGNKITPEELQGYTLPFIMNLVPVKMMGITSEAMIMVNENEEGKIIITNLIAGYKII